MLLIEALLAVASTRIVSMINGSAVALELVLVVVLAIALIIAVMIQGDGAVDNLISRGVTLPTPTSHFAKPASRGSALPCSAPGNPTATHRRDRIWTGGSAREEGRWSADALNLGDSLY